MITDIYIPEEFKSQYYFPDQRDCISKLNRINIFIGPNNSGKSRFLRGLFINNTDFKQSSIDFNQLNEDVHRISELIEKKIVAKRLVDVEGSGINGVLNTITTIKNKLKTAKLPDDYSTLLELKEFVDRLSQIQVESVTLPQNVLSTNSNYQGLNSELGFIGLSFRNSITEASNVELLKHKKIYIPILRGLRPLQSETKDSISPYNKSFDNYKHRTIHDYFPSNKSENLDIFTGLSLYDETTDMLLGSSEERKKIKDFEEFLSKTFFNGQTINLIPNRKGDCLNITLGEEERPIHSLGDGIQSLIVLLYPIFFNSDKPILCFIEEPELSLHPGMQRLFIDTIINQQFNHFQFFITTHSNHLLDMILDHSQISIYNFENDGISKNKKHLITNTSNEDIKLLDSIGVRNSSVFLSNCTIWVEGICDRLYINKYLEIYQVNELGDRYDIDRLKEDLHFSYIEYGGANIVHYSFDNEKNWEKIKASQISSKILLIMDEDGTSENPTSQKSKRIDELKTHLGKNLIVLPCREIENTLSKNILLKTIQELENNENLNFESVNEKDYNNQYLGSYINNSISELKKNYAAQSGTISNKIQFCKTAIKHIQAIDDLSENAKDIAQRVWHFVKKNNQ
ncbi:ATP-dependent endonuclease [Niastella sp. OAS944]|uniref:AAA family ATPase n=1 Tax=Niastella sp. OAS944 TaxID=2664089 RepID=UPI0034871FC2|nr:putative ATP-dependent endonuclease of OLD family [Chitinophagaceae bacterium OAS944]